MVSKGGRDGSKRGEREGLGGGREGWTGWDGMGRDRWRMDGGMTVRE